METEIIKLPGSIIEIKIKLKGEEISPYLVMAAKDLSEEIEIKGFRKGEASPEIVEKILGTESILEKAANLALNKIFLKIVKEKNLEILGRVEGKTKKLSKEEFEGTIRAVIYPEIKLANWREIAKKEPYEKIEIKNEEIEENIGFLRKSRAKYIRSFNPIEKGNLVEIDYEIRQEGVKIEDGEIKGYKFIVGETKFIPGFEENLLGLKENEEKNFSLKAPTPFWKKTLEGKKLDFKVKIKEVFRVELPEANDEFARSLGKFENLEVLKKNISEGIKIEKEHEREKKRFEKIMEKISQKSEMEIPQILIEAQRDEIIEHFKKEFEQNGSSFDNFLLSIKKTFEEFKKELLPEAEKRTRFALCFHEIVKKENIKADKKEIETTANEMLKTKPDILNSFKNREEFEILIEDKILEKKVSELMK